MMVESIIIVAASSGIAAVFSVIISKMYSLKNKLKRNNVLDEKINELRSISDMLDKLKVFLNGQVDEMIYTDIAIKELKLKKEELEPIVNANEEAVRAMFKYQNKIQKKKKYIDYVVGFFIGVASSSLVALIFLYFNK